MQKTYKAIVSIIILITALIVSTIFWRYIKKTQSPILTIEEATNEIDHAKNAQIEISQKPFISKLPIRTVNYQIVYSGLKKEIVIIFNKNAGTLEMAKSVYGDEILNSLKEVGVDTITMPISWVEENQ